MESWNAEANDLFLEALELEPGERRQRFLDQSCGADGELRRRVDALLYASERAGSFLDPSTAAFDGPLENDADVDASSLATIGVYELVKRIGEGGFGEVWTADQREPVRRRVAIKILKPGMDSREVLARFEVERQALALMDHPNVAKVFDAGQTEARSPLGAGRSYFVMEHVAGLPIHDYCDTARLPIRERLELFVQVCRAVHHAHTKGLIHRDLKPANILVTLVEGAGSGPGPHPVPKVIDFGIAKATAAPVTQQRLQTEMGRLMGTPEYMSPEQAGTGGVDVDTRSDVYSLGVTLYQLLTGTLPLDSHALRKADCMSIVKILREQELPTPSARLSTLETEPVNQREGATPQEIAAKRNVDFSSLRRQLRGDLDWIVMKCLEKDRTRRYETAISLEEDIGRYLSGEPVVAAPPSKAYRIRKFVRRHRVGVAASVTVVAALLAGLAGTTWAVIWALGERDVARGAVDKFLVAAGLSEHWEQPLPQPGRAELFEAALRYFETITDDPSSRAHREAVINHALILHALHRYEDAISVLDRFLAQAPHSVPALAERGHMLRHLSRFEESRASLEEAARLAPNDPSVHARLGELYDDTGQWEKSLAERDRALALEPDSVFNHHGRGLALTGLRRFDEALAEFDRAIAISPELAPPHRGRGRVLEEGLGRSKEALAEFDRALAIDPTSASAHDCRGIALLALGSPEQALAAHDRAIEIEPNTAKYHVDRGQDLYHGLKRSEDALVEFDRALVLDPNSADAHLGRGEALWGMQRVEEALTEYDHSIALAPSEQAWTGRGNVLNALGRPEEGLEAYRKALALKSDYAWAWTGMGNSLLALDRANEAIEAQRQAVNLRPGLAEAHLNLANALYTSGATGEAIVEYRKACDLKHDFAAALSNLGGALAETGDIDGAIRALTDATRIQPTLAEPQLLLGSLEMQQGRFDEALVRLRQAQALLASRPDLVGTAANWISIAERKAALASRLDETVSGAAQPHDADERIEFAEILAARARHAEAARMYTEAFAEAPALADELERGHRYNAACCAVRAASSGDADGAGWRERALGWLRADLEAREPFPGLAATLGHWKVDPDLAHVRDHVGELPAAEREGWTRIWSDVDSRIAGASGR